MPDWRRVQTDAAPNPGPAWVAGHEADRPALESALPVATADDRGLMHFDLRPDNNTLISNGGTNAVVLDWNWTRPGPAWVDTVMLLHTAFGQLDMDAGLAAHPMHCRRWLCVKLPVGSRSSRLPTVNELIGENWFKPC